MRVRSGEEEAELVGTLGAAAAAAAITADQHVFAAC